MPPRLTLERLFSDPPLAGAPPNRLAFSRDGNAAAWLRGSDHDSEILDLWIARLPDARPESLVRTSDVMDVTEIQVSDSERAVQERLRLHQGGITSFAWCGADAERIVFPLSGELYLVHTADGRLQRLTNEPAARLDIRTSPLGSFVSFVRDGDLYAYDLRSGELRRLTDDATEVISNGLAEFIAQEEMDRFEGYFWSFDEAWLAFLRVDESPVSVKIRPRIHADRTEMRKQRYPAAGEPNAAVELRVLRLDAGTMVKVRLPAEDGYVGRVVWSRDRPKLWIQWQSRDQKRLVLFEAQAPEFEPREVITETDEAWVALTDDFHPLAGGEAFLWTTEKSGCRQLVAYRRVEGRWEHTALTSGQEPVVRVLGTDQAERRVFFAGATDMGREQHVFAVPLLGGACTCITTEPGWHEPVFCPVGPRLIDVYATFERPPVTRLCDGAGRITAIVDANPAPELEGIVVGHTQWVQLAASDGTLLNGVCMPPVGLVPGRRYPVLVNVYAGPGAQMVTRRFLRHRPFHALLNQHGFGVFLVDGRGTPHRDRAFSRAIHQRVGDVEIDDQVQGARWLMTQPWVDPDRLGIWGWSYGGYASLMAILREGTPFRAAAAVAPVTDWRLYDTHYTERYLGMPQSNRHVYDRADVLSHARSLQRPLLLLHGMADDNVLFEHTLRLMEMLQADGTPFELMVYPGRAHGLDGRGTQLHVYRTLLTFFERHLAASRSTESRTP